MRKKLAIALLLGVAALLSGQSLAQFDAIVDFATGLKELGRMLEDGRSASADTGKLYLLTGSISDVVPKTAWFFTLRREEILDPAAFAAEIRRGASALHALPQEGALCSPRPACSMPIPRADRRRSSSSRP